MLYFIVNLHSKSGYARVIWKQVKGLLQNQNVKYEVYFTEYKGHATKLVKRITEGNEKLRLVVLGGDGTMNEVVNGITHLDNVIIGYIPTGSSNDLARSLKLPSKPREAILNILKPKYFQKLDLGEVTASSNTRRFVVSMGIGFDASICHEALDSKLKAVLNKIKLGKLTYVGIALKQLAKFKTEGATIIMDGKLSRNYKEIYFISSHIHKYEGGGLKLCPQADYQDGMLDICVVNKLSKIKFLLLLPTAFTGKHIRHKAVDIIRCRELSIKTSNMLPVHADGESLGKQNYVTVKSIPEKLTIIAGNI
ncbi:diacylglycerol/lipid kinase family protein [Lachnotalea glycerini]|uniref:diacylglycerol/lipid kinase family protein n=1 Tax=Lachnotalea glycerini TaxID=1763509 RepID=UPI0015F2531A|nr:diacylglycerol kinase family protein [Lachnotalea glycerini]